MFSSISGEFADNFNAVSPLVSFLRLSAAALFGAIIGFEREWQGKPAGLRTHMLTSLAAALFIVVAQEVAQLGFGSGNSKSVDPLRLIEAVTSGVAFLAAGIIFTSGGKVKNITTGASLWLCGGIGLACGAGEIGLAAMATALTAAIIWVLGKIEDRHIGPEDDATGD